MQNGAQPTLAFPMPEPCATGRAIIEASLPIYARLAALPLESRVATLNRLREELRALSPFASEPVDCVLWIPASHVHANDYNPNTVAPPEMRLLEHSVSEDGFTQPIVAWRQPDQVFEVVDGFHRHRVGRESASVAPRLHGYLPLAIVNATREDRGDRIAATIRHNRARGKHQVEAMSDIVVELKRRNWSDEKIGRELGMDPDEVLRLCQISGLAEMFAHREFSEAWEAENVNTVNEEDSLDVLEEQAPEAIQPKGDEL